MAVKRRGDLKKAAQWQATYRARPEIKARKAAYMVEYRVRPTAKAKKRARRLGVPLEEMPVAPRDGRCQCCGEPTTKLYFDHDHELEALGFSVLETFRGWLCNRCNSGIGMFGDNIAGLEQRIAYLRRFADCVLIVPVHRS